MTKTLLAATVGAALMASAAGAETLKKVPASFNPAKAYVLVEYRLQKNSLSSFPGSRKYMPLMAGLSLARYDPLRGDVRGRGKAIANPLPGKLAATEPFRNREIAKSEGAKLFLLELEPDVWVVQGYGNTSFSLGSHRFTLEPGTVTDLGIVEAEADWAEGDGPATAGDIFKIALLGAFAKRPASAPMRASFRPRTAQDMPLPTGIAAASVRPVAFTPDARFGNYLGGLVNRIDGVNARLKRDAAER